MKLARPSVPITLSMLAIAAVWSVAAHAQTRLAAGSAKNGRAFALVACTGCHIVLPDQPFKPVYTGSPHPPDFKEIANRPDITADKLRNHLESLKMPPKDGMPDLMLTGDQIANAIAFIASLRNKADTR